MTTAKKSFYWDITENCYLEGGLPFGVVGIKICCGGSLLGEGIFPGGGNEQILG